MNRPLLKDNLTGQRTARYCTNEKNDVNKTFPLPHKGHKCQNAACSRSYICLLAKVIHSQFKRSTHFHELPVLRSVSQCLKINRNLCTIWQVANIASEASYARWYTNERIVPNNQRLRPCVYFWCMYCCWLCNNGDLGAKIQIMEDSDTKWKAHYFRREYSNVRKEHWHLRWKLLYQTEWNSCKIDFKVSNSSLSNLQNDLPVKVLLEFVHHPWIPSNITVHF